MIIIVKAGILHFVAATLVSVLGVLVFSSTALAHTNYQPSAWAVSRIEIGEKSGLTSDDFADLDFTDSITRRDFCQLLINSCRIFDYDLPKVPKSHPFSDCQDECVLPAPSG